MNRRDFNELAAAAGGGIGAGWAGANELWTVPAVSAQNQMLDRIQRAAFAYFLDQVNPVNGLVKDCTREGFPSSIAAVGFGLAAYPVGVERGFLTRPEAGARALATLRLLSR